jgi:hypothetical protein
MAVLGPAHASSGHRHRRSAKRSGAGDLGGAGGELGGELGGVVYVHSSCSNGNSLAEPYNDVYHNT